MAETTKLFVPDSDAVQIEAQLAFGGGYDGKIEESEGGTLIEIRSETAHVIGQTLIREGHKVFVRKNKQEEVAA